MIVLVRKTFDIRDLQVHEFTVSVYLFKSDTFFVFVVCWPFSMLVSSLSLHLLFC